MDLFLFLFVVFQGDLDNSCTVCLMPVCGVMAILSGLTFTWVGALKVKVSFHTGLSLLDTVFVRQVLAVAVGR